MALSAITAELMMPMLTAHMCAGADADADVDVRFGLAR